MYRATLGDKYVVVLNTVYGNHYTNRALTRALAAIFSLFKCLPSPLLYFGPQPPYHWFTVENMLQMIRKNTNNMIHYSILVFKKCWLCSQNRIGGRTHSFKLFLLHNISILVVPIYCNAPRALGNLIRLFWNTSPTCTACLSTIFVQVYLSPTV